MTPSTPAGQLLAYVTEVRSLRSDLHASALLRHDLAGPTARALDRLWKGTQTSDDDLDRLDRAGLARQTDGAWELTSDARRARERAEQDTEKLTTAALVDVAEADISGLLARLLQLPGEDPRPADAR